MASSATKGSQKNVSVNKWLIAGLGVLIVIAILFAISNKKEASDPTLTAAPPIVATPGHPVVPHTKSADVMAKQIEQTGMAPLAGAPGQSAPR